MTKQAKGARSGRFSGGLHPDAAAMNASIGFDHVLARFDVRGSQAHARMLGHIGLLSQTDVEQIVTGLDRVLANIRSGEIKLDPALEDIHMNVEARLTAAIGDAGARLHTGRSRNDQVALDMRLFALDAAATLRARLDRLVQVFCTLAQRDIDVILPGYTHLQRAQPIRLGHHWMAYVEMFERDRTRLVDFERRTAVSPLGSGALAGSNFPLDRERVAAELGMHGITRNSLDAVSDRDFVCELAFVCTLIGVHLSRLGEELVLWSSQEFQFIQLPEGYCSGSSLMPQKVNPDIPELVRAKVGRLLGGLVTLVTVLKGLPLAYNKDLQESQEPLIDSVTTVEQALRVVGAMMEGVTPREDKMARAVDEGHLTATELADHLVARGVPFRTAHDQAGSAVRRAIELGVDLRALPRNELLQIAPETGPDVADWLDPVQAIERRKSVGGPSKAQVQFEIERVLDLVRQRGEQR